MGGEEDPELPFFGSAEKIRGINALQALIMLNYCDMRIIVFFEGE